MATFKLAHEIFFFSIFELKQRFSLGTQPVELGLMFYYYLYRVSG